MISATHKLAIEIVGLFFSSFGDFCADNQAGVDKLPQLLHQRLPVIAAKFVRAPGPEPADLVIALGSSSAIHHP